MNGEAIHAHILVWEVIVGQALIILNSYSSSPIDREFLYLHMKFVLKKKSSDNETAFDVYIHGHKDNLRIVQDH